MKKWRPESALDLYNLLLAMFLLISPWLFVRVNETAAVDLRASGAVIAVLSLAAMVAFSSLEEWANLLLGILAHRFTLGAGLCSYPRDAFQYRRRRSGGISGRT